MSKILLVEDDPFLSSLLKNRLQKEGLETILARDGEEALKFLKTEKVNFVLLDIILPKKSGFEVMEEIRLDPYLQGQAVPIIVISNLGQEEDIVKCRNLGAIEYFIKEKTSLDDLVRRIRSFLEEAK